MITKEQALKALREILILHIETNISVTDATNEAIDTLTSFIEQQTDTSEVKVVYEYKLRDEMTGMYRDASNWTKKGKTYRSRNNMNSAIAYIIEPFIDNARPKNAYTRNAEGQYIMRAGYNEEYAEYSKNKADKEWRAKFIPETFIVECIPVNTKADILRINARDFYLGKKENDNVQTEQRTVDS